MRRWLSLLVLAALSGCTGQSGVANPNLQAPEIVLAPRPDGNFTVYVHAAFGDRAYEWLSLSLDNRTVVNRTHAYSLEEAINGTSFFAVVSAAAGDQLYDWRARVEIVPSEGTEHARIARLGETNEWGEPRTYSLPYTQILDHPRSG
ncbi:MAG: hypothetical protein QOE90_2120 [Thermoplasmata archaeon]|jgi:hypothetical protein|nr:hypothetical protein [Thermoplasmata archaeon]